MSQALQNENGRGRSSVPLPGISHSAEILDMVSRSQPSCDPLSKMEKAVARSLLLQEFLSVLRGGSEATNERPGSWRIAAAAGALGRYEAFKSDLQNSGIPAGQFARGCRSAARKAGV